MLILSLAVLVVGWSALWLFARHEAQSGLRDWIAAEREEGRIWTCPDRRFGGFPLGIVLSCAKPTFAEVNNERFGGELSGLRAEAQLYFPTSVAIDLTGPLKVHDQAIDADLTVSWSAARLTLRGDLPGTLDRGQLDADTIQIAAQDLTTPIRIGQAELGFKPLPQKAVGPADAELTIHATGVVAPDVNAAFGSPEPLAMQLLATLSRLPSRGVSLPTLLEAWREAGGQLDLTRFDVAKGSFHAKGTGRLQIDDEHRLEGRLDARVNGVEPIAARYGIPVEAVKIGGLLSGLIGGKASANGSAPDSAVALPIAARAGRLYFGPVKTALVSPPLY